MEEKPANIDNDLLVAFFCYCCGVPDRLDDCLGES